MPCAGGWHTCLLCSDGEVVASGKHFGDQLKSLHIPGLKEGTKYVDVAASVSLTVFLRDDGEIVTIGGFAVPRKDPVHGYWMRSCSPWRGPFAEPFMPFKPITQMAVGEEHAAFLFNDGTVVAFGNNEKGQCDIPILTDGRTYTQIAVGQHHTVFLRSDGTVDCIGCPTMKIPRTGDSLCSPRCTHVSACGAFNAFFRRDGILVVWGEHHFLTQDTDYTKEPNPDRIRGDIMFAEYRLPGHDLWTTYTQLECGFNHVVALRSDGIAVAVGCNRRGQCDVPDLEAGAAYIQVSAGYCHTVLLREDGRAVAVGDDRGGQCILPEPRDGVVFKPVPSSLPPCDFVVQIEYEYSIDPPVARCWTVGGRELASWPVHFPDALIRLSIEQNLRMVKHPLPRQGFGVVLSNGRLAGIRQTWRQLELILSERPIKIQRFRQELE